MTRIIRLADSLVEEEIDEEFSETMVALNVAAAKGMTFVAMDNMNGGKTIINMKHILTVKEREE